MAIKDMLLCLEFCREKKKKKMTGENLYQRDVRQQIKKPTQQGSRVRFFFNPKGTCKRDPVLHNVLQCENRPFGLKC